MPCTSCCISTGAPGWSGIGGGRVVSAANATLPGRAKLPVPGTPGASFPRCRVPWGCVPSIIVALMGRTPGQSCRNRALRRHNVRCPVAPDLAGRLSPPCLARKRAVRAFSGPGGYLVAPLSRVAALIAAPGLQAMPPPGGAAPRSWPTPARRYPPDQQASSRSATALAELACVGPRRAAIKEIPLGRHFGLDQLYNRCQLWAVM
jgi:hypothetical protein